MATNICHTDAHLILISYNNVRDYFKSKGEERIEAIKNTVFTENFTLSLSETAVSDQELKVKALSLPQEMETSLLKLQIPQELFDKLIHLDSNRKTFPLLKKALNFPKDLLIDILSLTNPMDLKLVLCSKDFEKARKDTDASLNKQNQSVGEIVKGKICGSQNRPANTENADLQYHPPIAIDSLTDERVKRRTPLYSLHTGLDQSKIHFQIKSGICTGESYWFIYLYFKSKHLFPNNPKAHIAAVGKQFENGGENESILIQSLYNIKKGKIIDLKIDDSSKLRDASSKTLFSDQLYDDEEATHILSRLDDGAYLVDLDKHQCVYIQESKNLSYYFDPNEGVIELSGNYRYHQLMALLKVDFPKKCKDSLQFRICHPR